MSHTHYNNSRQLWTSHKSVCHSSPAKLSSHDVNQGFYCCTDRLRTTIWLSASHAKKNFLNDQLREEKREGLCLFLLLSHSPDRKKKQKSLIPNLTHTHKHTHVPRLKVSCSSHTHRLLMWQSKQNASPLNFQALSESIHLFLFSSANKFWMINWDWER